jgi:Protein of unknown function (DUF3833)
LTGDNALSGASTAFRPERHEPVFENSHGQPRRYFTFDSYGKRIAAGDFILNQHFLYSDGKTQDRAWQIHQVASNRWNARADDRKKGNFAGSWTLDVQVFNAQL